MPIFRYPFYYNNYGTYYNRPNPYGPIDTNLHKNTNEYNKNNINTETKSVKSEFKEERAIDNDNQKNNSKKQEESNYFFELFGLKLYFDDVLLICLIFFLYQEGVKDDELFISLILLLLS